MTLLLAPFVGPYIAWRVMWAFYFPFSQMPSAKPTQHADILKFPKRGGV